MLTWFVLHGAGPSALPPAAERVQFVLFSFDVILKANERVDDNKYVRLRQKWRDHGDATFTIFFNTGQLLLPRYSKPPAVLAHPEDYDRWHSLRAPLGRPRNLRKIPYSRSLTEMDQRVRTLRHLHQIGVEIGSHSVRHLRGGDWSKAKWLADFREHNAILGTHGLPLPAGFRAPHLEKGPGLMRALASSEYRFDSSAGADRGWPRRVLASEVWELGIPSVQVPGVGPIILFDLKMHRALEASMALRDSECQPVAKGRLNRLYYRIVYREFLRRYHHGRAPLVISGHGAQFLGPSIKLVKTVCERPKVRCGTFSEAVAYLDEHLGPPTRAVTMAARTH